MDTRKASSPPDARPTVDITDLLPDEIVLHIFSYLPVIDLCRTALVERQWHRLASHDSLWKDLYFSRDFLNKMLELNKIEEEEENLLMSGSKKRGRKKKKDPEQPKRPLSSYMCFAQAERPKVKQQNPGIKPTEVTRILGQQWRTMSAAEKRPYENEAKLLKENYEQQLLAFSGNKLEKRKLMLKQQAQQAFEELRTWKRVYLLKLKEISPKYAIACSLGQIKSLRQNLMAWVKADQADRIIDALKTSRSSEVMGPLDAHGNNLLLKVADTGKAQLLRQILEQFPTLFDVNQCNNQGNTALHIASIKGKADAVEILLSQPNISLDIFNRKGQTPLLAAVTIGYDDTTASVSREISVLARRNPDIVRLLIEKGASIRPVQSSIYCDSSRQFELIRLACAGSYHQAIDLILQKDASLIKMDSDELYDAKGAFNHLEIWPRNTLYHHCRDDASLQVIVKHDVSLSRNYINDTPTTSSSSSSAPETPQLLINRKNASGVTPLMAAVSFKRFQVVDYLWQRKIEFGINHNLPTHQRDLRKRNLLHLLVHEYSPYFEDDVGDMCATSLFEDKTTVELHQELNTHDFDQDEEEERRKLSYLRKFIEAGVSPTETDLFGATPLHYAAAFCSPTLLRQLIEFSIGDLYDKGVSFITHDTPPSTPSTNTGSSSNAPIENRAVTDSCSSSTSDIKKPDEDGEDEQKKRRKLMDLVINARDGNNRTPLHYAVVYHNWHAVRLLLNGPYRAAEDVQDSNGRTPFACLDRNYIANEFPSATLINFYRKPSLSHFVDLFFWHNGEGGGFDGDNDDGYNERYVDLTRDLLGLDQDQIDRMRQIALQFQQQPHHLVGGVGTRSDEPIVLDDDDDDDNEDDYEEDTDYNNSRNSNKRARYAF